MVWGPRLTHRSYLIHNDIIKYFEQQRAFSTDHECLGHLFNVEHSGPPAHHCSYPCPSQAAIKIHQWLKKVQRPNYCHWDLEGGPYTMQRRLPPQSASLCLTPSSSQPVFLPVAPAALHLLLGLCLGQPSLGSSPSLVSATHRRAPLSVEPITKAFLIPHLDRASLVLFCGTAELVPASLAHLD